MRKSNGTRTRTWLPVIIAGLLLLLLQACGSASEPAQPEAPAPVATSAPAQQAMQPTQAPAAAPTSVPAEAPIPEQVDSKRGGTLNLPSTSAVQNLDPYKSGGWNYCEVCYGHSTESLVILFEEEGADYGSLVLHPYLLESWELVDATTYDLHLHQGVHFQDVPPANGRELTAEDVVWSFEHMRQPDPLYVYRTLHQPLDRMEALDPYTVRMHLKFPAFAIMRYMGLPDGSQIIPRELEDDPAYDADSTVIGTGPFIMKEWIEGTSFHLERNSNYWRDGQPYLDEVNMLIMPDAAARIAAFRSDRIQILDMEWGQAQNIWGDSQYVIERYPGNQQRGIGFQHRRPPFNDILMRQAARAALNLQAFVDILDDGEGRINTGYWWSMTNLALDQSFVPKQDLTAARSLMVEAGYDPEVGVEVVTICRAGDPYQCRIQEIVQDQLAEIGINTTIETLDVGTWRERAFTQYDYDIYSYSAPAHEIPERFHNLFVYGPSSFNTIGSADQEIDAAIEFAGASADQAEYEARWAAYQKIFLDKVPYVFLDTPYRYTAQQPYLKGYRNSVAGYNRFQWISEFWFDK